MEHIFVLIHILSFSAGLIVILLLLILFLKYRLKIFINSFILLCILSINLIFNFLEFYLKTNIPNTAESVFLFIYLIFFVWNIALTNYLPRYFYFLIEKKLPKFFEIIFALSIPYGVAFCLYPFIVFYGQAEKISHFLYISYINVVPFALFSILFSLISIIVYYKEIKNKVIKKIIKTTIILGFIFFPGFIFDGINVQLRVIYKIPEGLFFTTIFYFIWNIFNIYYIVQFYMEKINIVIHPEINEAFIHNFSISKRETEIIKDLIKRKKTRQIGEHFFISPKTVENHIASIYRKAGVSNREELIEKIKDSE